MQNQEIRELAYQVNNISFEVSKVASTLNYLDEELFKALPKTREIKALETEFIYGTKHKASSIALLGNLQDISDKLNNISDKLLKERNNQKMSDQEMKELINPNDQEMNKQEINELINEMEELQDRANRSISSLRFQQNKFYALSSDKDDFDDTLEEYQRNIASELTKLQDTVDALIGPVDSKVRELAKELVDLKELKLNQDQNK